MALYREAQAGLRRVVALGLYCFDLKENHVKHGQFQKWLADHCAEVSYRTVAVYMDLTQAAVERCGFKIGEVIQKCSTLHFCHSGQLLLLPEVEMPGEARDLRTRLCELLEGKSIRQLMRELRPDREPGAGVKDRAPMTPEEKVLAEDKQALGLVSAARHAIGVLITDLESRQGILSQRVGPGDWRDLHRQAVALNKLIAPLAR